MNLPSFTGKPNEDLERFLEQLTNLLLLSGVPSRHFVTYSKQQVKSDSRAYHTIRQAEEEHSNILHTDDDTQPSYKNFLDYFNAIKETLLKNVVGPRMRKFVIYFVNIILWFRVQLKLFQNPHTVFSKSSTLSKNWYPKFISPKITRTLNSNCLPSQNILQAENMILNPYKP